MDITVTAIRPIAQEYGGGVAKGPLLVMEVVYENRSAAPVGVFDVNFRVFTDLKTIDLGLDGGDYEETYGLEERRVEQLWRGGCPRRQA